TDGRGDVGVRLRQYAARLDVGAAHRRHPHRPERPATPRRGEPRRRRLHHHHLSGPTRRLRHRRRADADRADRPARCGRHRPGHRSRRRYDTSGLTPGPHTVTAAITQTDGTVRTVTASFTVTALPPGVSWSRCPDRRDPQTLDGANVTGVVYITATG